MPGYHQRAVTGRAHHLILAAVLLSPTIHAQFGDLNDEAVRVARVGFSRGPTFSPDGERIAFVSDVSGSPQVWVVPLDGGWPARITALEDPVSSVAWSPAGDRLALVVKTGASTQIYSIRSDGSGLRRLTLEAAEVNLLGSWSPDGRLLSLASDRRGRGSIDAYVYDVTQDQSRLIAGDPGVSLVTGVSSDARWAILQRTGQRGDEDLFLIDLPSGRERLITPHEPPGIFMAGRFSPDHRFVYLITDLGRDNTGLAVVPLGEDGLPGPVEMVASREDAGLDEFSLSADGATAALLWNVSGRSELAFVDLVSGRVAAGPALPAEVGSGMHFSPDGAKLVIAVSGAVAPQDIWLLDRQTAEYRRLTRSPRSGVDSAILVRPRLIEFLTHDGLELSGWLYIAPGAAQPGPAVLSIHPGPGGQERPVFRADYQALLARGISVFAPNVRGSSGFGRRFADLDDGALRANAIRDVRASVDRLVASGIADPGRIGIYGGYAALAGLTEYPRLFGAAAIIDPVTNLDAFVARAGHWQKAAVRIEYGDPDTQSDMLRALSPAHRLNRVQAPTIVLRSDAGSPIEADLLLNDLSGRGVSADLVPFNNMDTPADRVRIVAALVSWFNRHLNE